VRLALVISSLRGGGAERVMVTLANAWAAQGVSVTLVTLAARSTDTYAVDPAVTRIDLYRAGNSHSLLHGLASNLGRARALRKALLACRPDVVVSFIARSNMLTIVALTGLRIPVIVAEHIFVGAKAPDGLWGMLHGPLYRRAAAVVTLTQRGARYIETRFGCPVTVIPNPVPFPAILGGAPAGNAGRDRPRNGPRTLLAVGRLEPQKGFDLLIEAFAEIADRHPDWNLRILGEGPTRKALMLAVARSGLSDRISMPGFSNDVREEMQRAELFVLSSRFEGFPMALLEAMSEGLACVSFDCETGPGELIRHNENGWLVSPNDVSALAEALDVSMRDADLRMRLGSRAREVTTTYSLSAVLAQWDELLESVLSRAGRTCVEP
jgi:glycosyltransferase involved in cell wall biosynthesis